MILCGVDQDQTAQNVTVRLGDLFHKTILSNISISAFTINLKIFILVRIHSCLDDGSVGKQPLAWKEICAKNWLKELQESMVRCTVRHNITEITLKTVLNAIESIYRISYLEGLGLTLVCQTNESAS